MADTKEKILMTALHLFASEGYEAISVSTIAGALGMTKGALYKHYVSKRDIFDQIVARMFQTDAQRAYEYEVPEETYEAQPEPYGETNLEQVRQFTLAQLTFWTEDDFASHFRKMLSLERYRDPEMGKLYDDCIGGGPVRYLEDLFREMMSRGILKTADPKLLALEYFSPLHLLIQMYDAGSDPQELQDLLECHIDRFIQTNTYSLSNQKRG